MKKKILHVITDLGQGGAEAVLFRLVASTRDRFQHAVVSLHSEGVYASRLRELGIPVTALEMPRGRVTFAGLKQLRRTFDQFCPDVVQTRLDHANLIGGLMARMRGKIACVWAVHSSDLGSFRNSWKTRLVRQFSAWLSRHLPMAITSDAVASADLHVKAGFSAGKFIVIPNGVDAAVFRPDEAARQKVRADLRVVPDAVLIGCVARWDAAKDHENLVRAVALLAQQGKAAFTCVLVGGGMTGDNEELREMLARHAVADRFLLSGPAADVPAIMSALDLHVLPSRSESQPVAVLEAMSCAIPCVVTDVGDSAAVVGDTGWVVPARDASALAVGIAAAVAEIPTLQFTQRKQACRKRIVENFSLDRMANQYASIWDRAAQVKC